MALLTTQVPTAAGAVPTLSAATATTGDTFSLDDRTFIQIVNGSGGSINAVFTSYRATSEGYVVTDKTVAVGAGVTKLILLDPVAYTDPTTNLAKCVCSAVTTVTIAAIRRP